MRAVADDGTWAAVGPRYFFPRGVMFVALPGGERVGGYVVADGSVHGLAFAPAGDRAAVVWNRGNVSSGSLDIVAVPSGQVLRQIELPPTRWWEGVGWHGDRVVVTAVNMKKGEHRWTSRTYQIDLTATLPALEPRPAGDRDGYDEAMSCRFAPNWVGAASPVERLALAVWRDRLFSRLGVTLARDPADGWAGRVTTFHPDGSAAGEFTVRGRVDGLTVAPDGTSAAVVSRGRVVEMWDTDPPSPGPRAALAGVVAVAAWAWLERRRGRR